MNQVFYKQVLGNRNVPKEVEVIGTVEYMSGEIHDTYYLQRYEPAHPEYGGWAYWKVCDWVDSKPQPTCMAEIKRVGLDSAFSALRKNLILNLYTEYAPSELGVDSKPLQQSACDDCGHKGLAFHTFFRTEPHSYRAFGVCPDCGFVMER